jgi:hypothetical protein
VNSGPIREAQQTLKIDDNEVKMADPVDSGDDVSFNASPQLGCSKCLGDQLLIPTRTALRESP